MADNQQTGSKQTTGTASGDKQTGSAKAGVQRVDLFNPTKARRIIHDGIEGSQLAITVEPGQIKRNVELSDAIVKELKDRTKKRGTEKSDLIVHPAGQAPDPKKEDDSEDEE